LTLVTTRFASNYFPQNLPIDGESNGRAGTPTFFESTIVGETGRRGMPAFCYDGSISRGVRDKRRAIVAETINRLPLLGNRHGRNFSSSAVFDP